MNIESIVDSVLLESLARSVIGGQFVLIYCLAIVLGCLSSGKLGHGVNV